MYRGWKVVMELYDESGKTPYTDREIIEAVRNARKTIKTMLPRVQIEGGILHLDGTQLTTKENVKEMETDFVEIKDGKRVPASKEKIEKLKNYLDNE